MMPSLVFGLPIVIIVTGVAGLASPYTGPEQLGLVGLGLHLTVVSVTVTPAVGMALPRFSAIRVGQSRDVLPPRMSAVAVHAALTVGPGTVLAALVIAPGTARAVLAGLFGFVPAALLELLSGSNEGLLSGISGSFSTIGQTIQGVGPGQLQIVGGSALLIGGVLVLMLLYRNAVHRFEQYTPS